MARKSIEPILIVALLILVAYVAYKAYVAIQSAVKYPRHLLRSDGKLTLVR